MDQGLRNQEECNMKIGPKYKIARRLGAPVFEKTQTQKYALSEQRREKSSKRRPKKPRSDYGAQLLEKQKARYTYCLTERQFSKYVKNAVAKKNTQTTNSLFAQLETRIDNAVYKIGFAPTRLAARQMVSHGHIMLNGRRITIPSAQVKEGDEVSIRKQSIDKPLFTDLSDRLTATEQPNWLMLDVKSKVATVKGMPTYIPSEAMFDLNVVLEFYSR